MEENSKRHGILDVRKYQYIKSVHRANLRIYSILVDTLGLSTLLSIALINNEILKSILSIISAVGCTNFICRAKESYNKCLECDKELKRIKK